MIILLILLIVFVCLTALLLFPLRLTVNFDGEFELVINYLFIKLKFPQENAKKPKTVKKPTIKKDTSGKKTTKSKPKHKLSYYIDEYKTPIKNILKSLNKLLRKIVVKSITLDITVAEEDASKTAIEYGLICASVYPLLSALESYMEVKNKSYNISTNFEDTTTKANIFVDLRLRPMYALATLFALLYTFLKYKVKR